MAFPIRPTFFAPALLAFILCLAPHCRADWQVLTAGDQRQARPPKKISNATPIKPGDRWPTDNKFRWLIGELEIPPVIGKESAAGKSVGLQLSVGDGGEVWIDGELQCRFDNDHPALVVLATNATTSATVRVDIQVYGKVQGGDKFDQANWVILDPKRLNERLALTVDMKHDLGPVPNGIVGLSQGGGVSDYEEATAKKLQQGGFKWFRMDNVFTGALKKDKATGELTNDWRDLDKRVDFIRAIGADPILCVSYMPQVLDAVPNGERQSAPKDYGAWKELCFQAAKHCLDRDRRVPFWEVWNEVNTGWLKPGPDDTGSDAFRNLYTQALGREDTNGTKPGGRTARRITKWAPPGAPIRSRAPSSRPTSIARAFFT